MKYIYGLILLMTSFSSFAINTFYKEIPDVHEVKGQKVIIQEFFFYGCQHCMDIENPLSEWKKELDFKKVEFEKIPINFGSLSSNAAKHFYAAKLLKKEQEFSKIYFKELINKNKKISDQLAIDILVSLGEKEEKIKEAINSHSVENSAQRANELSKQLKIYEIPTFVINGKYKVDAKTAKGKHNIFKSIDLLIEE